MSKIILIWPEILIGSILFFMMSFLGLKVTRHEEYFPIRFYHRWIDEFLLPPSMQTSWLKLYVIGVIETLFTSALAVFSGTHGWWGWLWLLCWGFLWGMQGYALERQEGRAKIERSLSQLVPTGAIWKALGLSVFGFASLAICAGLCLSQGALSLKLQPYQAAHIFWFYVMPMGLIGMAGAAWYIILIRKS